MLVAQYMVGDGVEVRRAAFEIAQGLTFTLDADSPVVEIRKVPKGCGHDVFDYYLKILDASFQTAPLSNCATSNERVDCPTHYLPNSARLFFHLGYRHEASRTEMSLRLVERQSTGETGDAVIPPNLQHRFVKFFDCLRTLARCPEMESECSKQLML